MSINKIQSPTICIIPEGSLDDPENFVANIRLVEPLNVLNEKYGLKWFDGSVMDMDFITKYADIIIIQRTPFKNKIEIEKWLENLYKLRSIGKIIIYEIDDYFYNPSMLDYFSRIEVIDEDAVELVRKHHGIFEITNYVSVSSDELASAYKKNNLNIFVILNYLELRKSMWYINNHFRKNGERVILGWSGGSRVGKDLEILPDILDAIFSKYNNVDFLLCGATKYLKIFDSFPEKRILSIGWLPYLNFTQSLSLIDIALIPMEDNSYNRCKTPLKIMDFGALGIPAIASNVVPYKDFIRHGETGFLANDLKEWIYYLSILIEEKQLRLSVGAAIKQFVWRNCNLQNNIKRRYDFYKEALGVYG